MILEIVAVVFIFIAQDDLRRFAKSQWNGMSDSAKQDFEERNACCGFETIEGLDCIGCYDKIEKQLQNNFTLIFWTCIGVFVYQLGLAIFGCILVNKIPPSKYRKVSNSRL